MGTDAAYPSPADVVDRSIEALQQARAPAQLAHHRPAAVGGEGGLVGDDPKGWALALGAHPPGAPLDAPQPAHKPHIAGTSDGIHRPGAALLSHQGQTTVTESFRTWSAPTVCTPFM
jgi:hypothetical protein